MRDILEINDQVRRVKEKSSLSIFLKILPDIGFWYSHHVHTWTSLSTDHHDTMIVIEEKSVLVTEVMTIGQAHKKYNLY